MYKPLGEPVPCTVPHYHPGATKIRDRTLAFMIEELQTRLRQAAARITPMTKETSS